MSASTASKKSVTKTASFSAKDGFVRGRPTDAGVDPSAVTALLDDAEAAGFDIHDILIYRQGKLVVEGWKWPYRPEQPRIQHSVAKSFTACAIGLAVSEGAFRLSDKVVSFFPEHLPAEVDEKLALMTVEDLLTMRTGHESEVSGSIWRGIPGSWIAEFFKIPVVNQPGTAFTYSSAASYMLAAILAQTTGQTLHDYLTPRLFQPLGITGETWDVGPDGLNPGGNGLTCKAEDLLKLAILHGQDGVWQGRRILPADWVAEASRPRTHNDGYAYHWWTYPQGAYVAEGLFDQLAIVFPEHDAAIVINAAADPKTPLMPLVLRHFPAGFGAQGKGQAQLDQRLAEMARPIELPNGATGWRGERRYRMAANPLKIEEVAFAIRPGECTIRIKDSTGTHSLRSGLRKWIQDRTDIPGRDLHHGYELVGTPVTAGGYFSDDDTLHMTWHFTATAFIDAVTCRFNGAQVTIERSVNVNSGDRAWPVLTGQLV